MTERATDQETAILSNHLTHLLGAAQAHPDLEASEEELHHLVVLQVHHGPVQLLSSAPVVAQQCGRDQPEQDQLQHGEAAVE